MNQKIYDEVKALFADYEDTAELREFIEEISANLEDRVKEFVNKGRSEQKAYEKAFRELGDITEIADSISRQKRKEVIFDMFMPRVPLSRFHAAGFSLCVAIVLMGLVAGLLSALGNMLISPALMILMPFIIVSVFGFVYLGLTMETRTHFAMKRSRAMFYALGVGLTLLGLFLCAGALFKGYTVNQTWAVLDVLRNNAFGVIFPLAICLIPAIALFVFLGATEETRLKPHVLKQIERWGHGSQWIQAEIGEARFGILTSVLWTLAIAVFLVWGFLGSWSISWLVFPFAVAAQLALQFFMMNGKGV